MNILNIFAKSLLMIALSSSFALARMGGTSGVGGGGDISPADRVDVSTLFHMVPEARMQLLMYFNSWDAQAYYPEGSPGTWPNPYLKLVGGVKSISNKLRENKVFRNRTGPCLDKNGKAVDGSIYPEGGAEGICLSLFNLSQKVTKENANLQIIALLAHEYAHLAGANEDVADEIQRDVMEHAVTTTAERAQDIMNNFMGATGSASQTAGKYLEYLKTRDRKGLCMIAQFLERDFTNIRIQISSGPLSIMDRETEIAMNTVQWQVYNIVVGTCLYAKAPDTLNGNWSELASKYDMVFARGPVTARKFAEAIVKYDVTESLESGLLLPKLDNKKALDVEIRRFLDLVNVLEANSYGRLSKMTNE